MERVKNDQAPLVSEWVKDFMYSEQLEQAR